MGFWLRAGLVGLLVVAVLFVIGRRLFGPILVYDLVRTSRRGRFVLLRTLYAAALLAALVALYQSSEAFEVNGVAFNRRAMTAFSEAFFYTFVAVQFTAAVLLTPACIAGAIAEEKDRRTLEFLFATDLRNREIVLGKLAARLIVLFLLVLTGLPILSAMQLWGGVDPEVILAAVAATGLTIASIAALTLLLSVYVKRTRDAVVGAYLLTAAYLGLSAASLVILQNKAVATTAFWAGQAAPTIADLVYGFNVGNIGSSFYFLNEALQNKKTFVAVVPALLRDYALFHGSIFLVCVTWAVLRLRAVAVKDTVGPSERQRRRPLHHPPIDDAPMTWKEIYVEPGLAFHRAGRIVIGLIALGSLLPALWMGMVWCQAWIIGASADMAADINQWVRIAGTSVASLTLLGVALRAASSISSERDRQTLDGLLASPLEARDILFAKWLGSVLALRWAWLWLACIWALGVFMGGLDIFAVTWLLIACLAYASFFAALGLYLSATRTTTLRATLQTLAAAVALGGGHWFLGLACFQPIASLTGTSFKEFAQLETFVGTPPLALAWLSCHAQKYGLASLGLPSGDPGDEFAQIVLGLVVWGELAFLLLWNTRKHLRDKIVRKVSPPRIDDAPAASLAKAAASDSPSSRARRPRRLLTRKRLVLSASAALLFAGIGWYWYKTVEGDRLLADAIAEADRLDPNWRLDAEDDMSAQPAADGTFAPDVLIFHGSIPNTWLTPSVYQALENLAKGQISRQEYWNLTENLEYAEPALLDARRLKDLPRGKHPLTWIENGIASSLTQPEQVRGVLTLLQMDALVRIEDDAPDGALESIRGMIEASRSLGNAAQVSSQTLRSEYRGLALQLLWRTLAKGQPSEPCLAEVQRLLESEQAEPDALRAARSDRAWIYRFLNHVRGLRMTKQIDSLTPLYMRQPPSTWEMFELQLPGEFSRQEALALRAMTQLVEANKASAEERRSLVQQWEWEWVTQTRPPLARIVLPNARTSLRDSLCRHAATRCAIAMVAAERYRLKHRCWPDTLDDLVTFGLIPTSSHAGGDKEAVDLQKRDDGITIYVNNLAGYFLLDVSKRRW